VAWFLQSSKEWYIIKFIFYAKIKHVLKIAVFIKITII